MNKRVLVTGSSRGIGKAIAIKLAQDGFDLAVHCCHNREAGKETAEEVKSLGSKANLLQFDLRDGDQTRNILEQDLKENGPFYGVLCNAGIAADEPFAGMEEEGWKSVIETNLNGFYNVLHPLVLPMITEKIKGRIITISSISGLVGNRGQVNYSAAKAGIIGATKALAKELAKRSITVNCIAPGIIETDMVKHIPVDEVKKFIPMRRLGRPEEVAAVASFLMSEGASYITAEVITVSGGLV